MGAEPMLSKGENNVLFVILIVFAIATQKIEEINNFVVAIIIFGIYYYIKNKKHYFCIKCGRKIMQK
ncbi:MAG: hypothetical protein A2Y22_05730 [Clostridiales bacterium GWD2_32_59]|nr:MAG: hypothetical protein A2Y22_05730 [Clostridiales bacterium GWD2_32_59]